MVLKSLCRYLSTCALAVFLHAVRSAMAAVSRERCRLEERTACGC